MVLYNDTLVVYSAGQGAIRAEWRGTSKRLEPVQLNGTCFASTDATFAMHLQSSETVSKRVVIYYMAFPMEHLPVFLSGDEHCAPCTQQMMVDSFCQGDLIFKGRWHGFGTDSVSFVVDELLRRPFDPAGVFRELENGQLIADLVMKPCFKDYLRKDLSNEPYSYFVIAKTELAQAYLICAPLLNDWVNLRRTLLSGDVRSIDVPCDGMMKQLNFLCSYLLCGPYHLLCRLAKYRIEVSMWTRTWIPENWQEHLISGIDDQRSVSVTLGVSHWSRTRGKAWNDQICDYTEESVQPAVSRKALQELINRHMAERWRNTVHHFTLANIYAALEDWDRAMIFYYSMPSLQGNLEAAKDRIRAIRCANGIVPREFQ